MELTSPFRHTLPVNDFFFHQPLYVTQAGWEAIAPGAPYPPPDVPAYYALDWQEGRTLPEFGVALVIEGSGELEAGDRKHRLAAGQTFVIYPGEWERHRPSPRSGWIVMWVQFNGAEPLRWLREGLYNVRDNIALIDDPAAFRARMEYLIESVHRNPSANSLKFSLQAFGLLSHIILDPSPGAGHGLRDARNLKDEGVKDAVEFIWNFSYGIVDVAMVAHHAGIPRRSLERRFKTATGRSILEEIQSCRLARAVQLLEETSVPLKQIIHRAGFRSEAHMRLAFEKAYGASPRAYRQTHANQPVVGKSVGD